MSKKIVFLDPVSPRGHVSLNRFYLELFVTQTVILVVSNGLEHFYSDICKVKTFNANFLVKGRFFHFLSTLIISLKTVVSSAFKKNHLVVLLSYDITNLFIISYAAKLLKVELILKKYIGGLSLLIELTSLN